MEKEVVIIDYKEKYKEPLKENRVPGVDYQVMYDKISKKAQFDKIENTAYAKMKSREAYYEQIDLNYIFEKLQGIRRTKDKWKISSGNVIFTEDQRWQFVSGTNSDMKGRFGLKIVESELSLNSFQVIDWYTDNFGFVYDDSLKVGDEFLNSDYVGKGKNKNLFSPPFRNDENWSDVFRYLNEERNIPSTILNELFEQGKLYADTNSRCIFLSNASAEIRGTPASSDPGFKGCSVGGQADVSGFSIMPQLNANESVIGVTEAAIDAISYNVLYPGRYVFSSNGSGRFELHYKVALEGLTNGFRISMATDADMAGDVAAQKVFSAFLARNHIYEIYSKKNPEITYKEIDKAIINGHIIMKVDESPHHLYFNEIGAGKDLKDTYPVYEKMPNEQGVITWKDTGKVSEKEFAYKIFPGAFDFIEETVETNVKVESSAINNLLKKYHLLRDRPVKAKDWNEELKILGTEYSNIFNKCMGNNFKELPELPDYLKRNRKDVNPILINDKGEAYISKGKIEKKEINKEDVEDVKNEKLEPTVFTAKISRQQLFNTIYSRYYFNQKFNMSMEDIDEKLKNGDIKFYIDKNQPFLNFIDNVFSNKIEYISKNKEEGDAVFNPPTIRVHGNYLKNELKNITVAEKAFYEIIKRIDHLANILSSSKNQLQTLKEMNINCFEYNAEGLPLNVLMGRGRLIEKHEKLNSEKNEDKKKLNDKPRSWSLK